MTATPDVNRITPDPRDDSRLGYVDRAGVYHFRTGTTVPPTGGYLDPNGTRRNGAVRVVVDEHGSLSQPGPADAADPKATAASRRHCVNAIVQDRYDADPDRYDADPTAVFDQTA